jgi:DNA-binding SARP family transcriptional activator
MRLFGTARLSWGGVEVRPPTRKCVALLAYLAVRDGEVPRSELAELLWTGNGTATLRLELHRLRSLPGAAAWLQAGDVVRFDCDSDHAAFRRALEAGDDGAALRCFDGTAKSALLHGLELRSAPAFDEWRAAERTRLDALVREALARRAEALRRRGELTRADRYAERLLALDPSDESAHRTRIQTALERGDLRAAQRAFERCRRALAEELGVEPGPETRDLGQAVAWSLALPARAVSNRRVPPELLRPPSLVGRGDAWEALERAWRLRRAVIAMGPSGLGKSRLLIDFVGSVAPARYALVRGRPGDAATPRATLARALHDLRARRRTLARTMPEVGPESDEDSLAAALLCVLQNTDALVVDDLQAFDEASCGVLCAALEASVVAGAWAGGRVLVAWRADESPEAHRAAVGRLVAARVAEVVELRPLSLDESRRLLADLELGGTWGSELVESLHARSGGNPLYLLETLRALAERGRLEDPGLLSSDLQATERVRFALADRLGRLPEAVRRVAAWIAVVGDGAEASLLAEVADESAASVGEALARLVGAQLVEGMRFVHAVQREHLLEAFDEEGRRAAEAHVARVLERRGAAPELVAERWWAAGERARSRRWLLAAAEAALASGRTEVARVWLERLLAASDAEGDVRTRAEGLLVSI